jgi:hypothetical protein
MAITPGDIRARFEMALNKAINESKQADAGKLIDFIRPVLDKAGYDGKSESGRRPKHLRYMMGKTVSDTVNNINAILKKELNNYSVETVEPGNYGNGSYSGKYYTYRVKLEDAVTIKGLEFPAGLEFNIVNDDVAVGSFNSKALTPTGLGLPNSYLQQSQLISLTKQAVINKFSDQQVIVDLLHAMIDDVASHRSKYNFESPGFIKTLDEVIKYSNKTAHLITHFDTSDLNTVGKDFGEILGAIYMLGVTKYVDGIEFPSGNNPLVDFYIDGYGVSSKYKSGAAPTLSGIIKNIKADQLTTDAQEQLYKIFQIVDGNKVSSGYLEIAKYLQMPGYVKLQQITGIADVTVDSLNQYITEILAKNPDQFMTIFADFYKTIGRAPSGNKVEWSRVKDKKVYGAVVGPLCYHVTDILNQNQVYQTALTELLSKLEVKQLYLDFAPKKQEMLLHLKSFSNEGVKFTFEAPNQSVYSPDNGKLGFKMK